jgi:hypothetical protein
MSIVYLEILGRILTETSRTYLSKLHNKTNSAQMVVAESRLLSRLAL